MFWKRKYKCIACKRAFFEEDMYVCTKRLGICKRCHSEFKVSGDNSFEAKGEIKFLLSPFEYKGKVKTLVKKLKFDGMFAVGKVFGRVIAKELSGHKELEQFDMIVPVPLHDDRLLERGYNQSEVIAREISEAINIPCRNDVIVRMRNTRRQSSLKGMARRENVKDAFYADRLAVADKNIILVDDVYTMGETVDACAKALKESGAGEICAVTVCKTEFREAFQREAELPKIRS